MTLKALEPSHLKSFEALVKEILQEDGLRPSFYWPLETAVDEFASVDGVGLFRGTQLLAAILYRDAGGEAYDVSWVGVSPSHRRQGLADQLMKWLFNAAQQSNRKVWLEVHADNSSALKLYNKLGFDSVGERPRYYRDGSTAIFMEKTFQKVDGN